MSKSILSDESSPRRTVTFKDNTISPLEAKDTRKTLLEEEDTLDRNGLQLV